MEVEHVSVGSKQVEEWKCEWSGRSRPFDIDTVFFEMLR
jgi:hypothetical protein